MRTPSKWFWVCVMACSGTFAVRAGADPAAGEALFQEARRLFESGKIAEACERFADSQALDPSSGTLLNLADCHEERGKTATAWAEFLETARLAQMQHKAQHEREANRRAKLLEARLSYLTIDVQSMISGLEIRRDGQVIPAGVLGTAIPVDPGEHVVEASAAGYEPVRLSVTVGAAGDRQHLVVPRLNVRAGPPPAPLPTPAIETKVDAEQDRGSPNVLPWVIGGVGVAALGVGGIFGVLALQSDKDAEKACKTHSACSDDAIDAADRRDRQAWIANIGIGAGIVGVGVAAVMLITQKDGSSRAATVRPERIGGLGPVRAGASVASDGFALNLSGAF